MKSAKLTSAAVIATFALLTIPWLTAQEQAKEDHHVKHHYYKLTDIGTFGGPARFISATFNSVPALNSRGLAVPHERHISAARGGDVVTCAGPSNS